MDNPLDELVDQILEPTERDLARQHLKKWARKDLVEFCLNAASAARVSTWAYRAKEQKDG